MVKQAHSTRYRRRNLKDRLAGYGVTLGGVSVIIAILLIFFYLLYVVIPMFSAAEIRETGVFSGGDGQLLYIGLEEQGTMGVRISDDGHMRFFDTQSGKVVLDETLPLTQTIRSVADNGDTVALGLDDGTVLMVRYRFDLDYPDGIRTVTPRIEYPLGQAPLVLDEAAAALTRLVFQISEDDIGIAAATGDRRLVFSKYRREVSFISEEVTIEQEVRAARALDEQVDGLQLTPQLDHLYVAFQPPGDKAVLLDYTLDDEGFGEVNGRYYFDHRIQQMRLLAGGNSLLVALDNGSIQQWMQVRGNGHRVLTFIRGFNGKPVPVTAMAMERQRKGFAVADVTGSVTLFYTTSQRTLATINTVMQPVVLMAWSDRAHHLLVADGDDRLHLYRVRNDYPEVSWDVLWSRIWYEGYDEPDYIWQSSASTNDFEPKLSLVPLSFGTIKAAFYAMIFAAPIALLGAIFTAQFMALPMRQVVKPSIEIMEALPTVILGFLAGLWLAPFVETHLAGVFTLLILLPVGFVGCAWLWKALPGLPAGEGWEAAILIPVVLLFIWLSMALGQPVEQLFFGGDLRSYLSQQWGIGYDQRNALVVGLIMGFAVIPSIFSIAEDALFSVPQHLVRGSLALGATRWQTLMRVVLPAASPGIFSAVMMGFGRAVGETMIVLMATGNTPLMDMSIFQGMRTLAANLAVEIPEAEVMSTHYRVLFLAALILFLFTFVFNTLAEMIRHRLRKRYSGL